MEWVKLRKIRELIRKAAESLTDADALEGVELFEPWEADRAYAADVRLRYGDKLYRVVQAHTSQADWTPDVTPALYTEVSVEEWPAWRQPLGAEDAYQEGDKVSHNGAHWISTTDGNVWEPGVYGWIEEGA